MYRFRLSMKKTSFYDLAKTRSDMRYHRVTGFSFGSAPFMIRCYDKTAEIKIRPEKAYISQKWALNGFDRKSDDKKAVFRFEAEFHRDAIKSFIPLDIKGKSEVNFIFQNLSALWSFAVDKINFENISDDEAVRVMNHTHTEAQRSIFRNSKWRETSYDLMPLLRVWDNRLVEQSMRFKYANAQKESTVVKYVKAAIACIYKTYGESASPADVFAKIDRNLRDFEGISLIENAQLKVLGSFVQAERSIKDLDCMPQYISASTADKVYRQLLGTLWTLPNKPPRELRQYERFIESQNQGAISA